jgi:hypothetical protein
MDASTAVSLWRCTCGMPLKAITNYDPVQREQLSVACPHCGDERLIACSKLISVSEDTGALESSLDIPKTIYARSKSSSLPFA